MNEAEIPEPPDFLTEPARRAFYRIYHSLERQGLWDEIYLSMVAVAAQTCALYIDKSRCSSDAEREEYRLLARRLLADYLYLPINRVNLGALNSAGLDVDLVAICEPFTN